MLSMSATKAACSLPVDEAWQAIASGDATKYVCSLKLLCEADPADIKAGFKKLEYKMTLANMRDCMSAPDTAEAALSVAEAIVSVMPRNVAARAFEGFRIRSASDPLVGSPLYWLAFLSVVS